MELNWTAQEYIYILFLEAKRAQVYVQFLTTRDVIVFRGTAHTVKW